MIKLYIDKFEKIFFNYNNIDNNFDLYYLSKKTNKLSLYYSVY